MQVPNLFEMTREVELYTYLKDGTELCRMISLLINGRPLEEIVYRPNNISSLEEKNVSLFLRFVEKELNLPSLFGDNGSQVFKKFDNFFETSW